MFFMSALGWTNGELFEAPVGLSERERLIGYSKHLTYAFGTRSFCCIGLCETGLFQFTLLIGCCLVDSKQPSIINR